MDNNNIERNPSGIQPGEACYGVYLPAFTPEIMLNPIPGSKNIFKGQAMSSYDCRSKGGDDPAAMFLPDEPFPGTDVMSGMYDLYRWAIRKTESEAKTLRDDLARKMAMAYSFEIGELLGCI